MNTNRFLVSVAIAISFLFSGCGSPQGQATTSSVPVPTDTVPLPTNTAPMPTNTAIAAPTSTPTRIVTATITSIPDDGKYRPPQGNYAVVFSPTSGPGARVHEYYLPLSFETVQSDDFGGWKSIEYMRIRDEDLPIPEDPETRKKYLDFDLNALMERRITPDVPQGKIILQEYLQKDTTILFAVLDLPSGSNMYTNGVRNDAIRGIYIVIQGAYSYVISTQITPQVSFASKNMTQEEIIQKLKQDVGSFYDGIEFQTDPDVGRNFIPPTITPIPDPIDYIPDMKIPEGLFSPDAGSKNIDQMDAVLFTQGDWILVKNYQSIFPVPAGWTTIETGQETVIGFSQDGNLDNYLVLIRLGGVGYIGDNRTSEEVMAEFEKGLTELPSAALLDKKIVDDSKGYYFLTLTMDDGQKQNIMVLFSEDFQQGFYHRFMMYADPDEWDDYYPIARAMVDHWVDWDFRPLGMPLPDKVSSENAQSLYATPYPQGSWEIVPDAQAAFPAYEGINALAVDRLGRLWAGKTAGLGLLGSDGKWTTYTPDDSDLDNTVWNLAIDEQNRVWSDAGGSIRLFDPNSAAWITKLKSRGVNALAIDKQNRVWMGTNDGLIVIDPNGKETHYSPANSGLSYNSIVDLAIDAQGNLWVGNYLALVKLDANGKWTTFETGSDLPDGNVTSLAIDGQGQIWVGTANCAGEGCGGLSVLDSKGKWTSYPTPADVRVLATDDQGRVWVGTNTGLSVLDSAGKWTIYTPENSGIAPGAVSALAVDQKGQIWAQTVWLNVLQPDGKWKLYMPDVVKNSAFYDDWSYDLIVDRQGRMWVIAGYDNGLSVLDLNGKWKTYTTENSPLIGDTPRALAIDSLGQIWLATFDEGVQVITSTGDWKTFTAAEMDLGDEFTYSLAVDKQNRVWLATSGDLKMYEPGGGWKSYNTKGLGLGDVNIHDLAIDAQNRVWAHIWVKDKTAYQFAIFTPP